MNKNHIDPVLENTIIKVLKTSGSLLSLKQMSSLMPDWKYSDIDEALNVLLKEHIVNIKALPVGNSIDKDKSIFYYVKK